MKFQVTFKDPDTLYDCIQEAVEDEVRSIEDEEEREAVADVRREKMQTTAKAWCKYGEYLTVEFDTESGTCVVVRPK